MNNLKMNNKYFFQISVNQVFNLIKFTYSFSLFFLSFVLFFYLRCELWISFGWLNLMFRERGSGRPHSLRRWNSKCRWDGLWLLRSRKRFLEVVSRSNRILSSLNCSGCSCCTMQCQRLFQSMRNNLFHNKLLYIKSNWTFQWMNCYHLECLRLWKGRRLGRHLYSHLLYPMRDLWSLQTPYHLPW